MDYLRYGFPDVVFLQTADGLLTRITFVIFEPFSLNYPSYLYGLNRAASPASVLVPFLFGPPTPFFPSQNKYPT